jgi:biopolymer transport protein ExbB/TolQ
LWRRRKELGFGRLALVFVVSPLVLFGALGTLAGLVSAFAAVGGESVDPSQKARLLGEGVAQAMNCTAFGILFGVPSAIALALLTRKRDSKAT